MKKGPDINSSGTLVALVRNTDAEQCLTAHLGKRNFRVNAGTKPASTGLEPRLFGLERTSSGDAAYPPDTAATLSLRPRAGRIGGPEWVP